MSESGQSREPAMTTTSTHGAHTSSAARSARVRSSLFATLFLAAAISAVIVGRRTALDRSAVPAFAEAGMDRVVRELLSDLRAKVEQRPREADSWGQYGLCLLQHERPRESLACFRRAHTLDPDNPRWPWFSAMILEQTDLAAAADELELALRLAPDALHVRLKLAGTRLSLGDPDTAEELLSRVSLDSAAAAECMLQRARAARLRNAPQDSLKILKQAQQNGTGLSAELFDEAAVAAMQSDQLDLAKSLQHEARQQPPLQPLPDPWLPGLRAYDVSGGADSAAADQLRAQGRLAEAATRLAALARRFPDRSRPALNLALALRDQGQPQRAAEALRELADRFPQDPLVRFHLAVTEVQLGRVDAATADLRTCLQLKPDYGMARAALADLLATAGQLPDAVAEAERAVTDAPGDIWIHFGLIRLLLATGQADRVRQQLELAAALPAAAGQQEQAELEELRRQVAAAAAQGGVE